MEPENRERRTPALPHPLDGVSKFLAPLTNVPGLLNEVHKHGWKQWFTLPTFWKPNQYQAVRRAALPQEALGEKPALPLGAPVAPGLLGLRPLRSLPPPTAPSRSPSSLSFLLKGHQ